MLKRFAALALIITLLACLGSGCGKKDEYGSVGDAEITVGQEKDAASTIFTKLDNPFGEYEYNNIEFECARLAFDVPNTWEQQIYNNSCIRYDIPKDDPYFPGATCYIKCNYSYIAVEDELDPFRHYASEFSKNMSPYITGLSYHFGGKNVWIKSYSAADEQIEPTFCNDKTAACIKVTKNLVLVNKQQGDPTSFGQACLVAAYFRWHDFPVMMSIVVPNESAKDATDMMSYMMSSASSLPHKVKQTKEFDYRGIKAVVPTEFESEQDSGNILRSPSRSLNSSAGMSLAIFEANEDLEYVTRDYFQRTYATRLATLLADPESLSGYTVDATSGEGNGDKLVDEKKSFFANVNIVATDEDYIAAEKMYGTVSMWYMDCYFVERNGKNYIVAAMYPPQENELGVEIEKKAIETLAVSQ